jgi:hypothetical protein
VVTRSQLLDLDFSPKAIAHRIDRGRLHRLWLGVYAVGRLGFRSEAGGWLQS